MRPEISVIIPTFNEQETIQETIQKISHTLRLTSFPFEIIVVDDSSTDKTQLIVTDLILRKYPVTLITRTKDPGLSQSVMAGIENARAHVVVVTDADLSHDISIIPDMYKEIKRRNVDIVIGSRYMPGGGINDWPLKRRIISWVATFLSKILFPRITDPVSGFFAIKRELVIYSNNIKPRGYKILLEFLGKCRVPKVVEMPYVFQNRKKGQSKLKTETMLDFIKQLIEIGIYPGGARSEIRRMINFFIVGFFGVIANMVILTILKDYMPLLGASFIACELSILSNYILNDMWTFSDVSPNTWLHRMFSYNAIAISGMLINICVLGLLTMFGMWYVIANLIGIGLGAVCNFVLNRKITWKV